MLPRYQAGRVLSQTEAKQEVFWCSYLVLPTHNLELFRQRQSVFPSRGNATWANLGCVVLAVPENLGNSLSDIGLGSK